MKSDKILEMIPRLSILDEDNLDRINKAVNACVLVQVLKDSSKLDEKNKILGEIV